MKKNIIFLLMPLVYWTGNVSATFTLSLQNNPDGTSGQSENTFSLDDILELVIQTDTNKDSQLDLSPLSQDFNVVSQSKQVSHTFINGNASSKIQWMIGLQPKKVGVATIPSLTWGSDTSNSLKVKIKPAPTEASPSADIFMNVEADNQQIYLQSPLTLTVNIYISADIAARSLEIHTPEQSDYNLYKLGETNRQVFYKNKRYNLFQVKYLGFYNKPGNFNLPIFSLSGVKLKDNSAHNDIFSLYQQKWIPFNRSNPSIPLTVLDKPASFNGDNWLSADNLSVEQAWNPDLSKKSLPVGEAIVRVVTIKGTNVQAEQLPILYDSNNSNINNSYKMYVDKPEIRNSIEQDKLISSVTQKITYITTQQGQLNIPEYKITWWNNKTKAQQEAVLSSAQLNITKAATTNTDTSNQIKSTNQSTSTVINNPVKTSLTEDFLKNQLPKLKSPGEQQPRESYMLTMLAIIIFLLIIVITYLLVLISKHQRLNKNVINKSDTNYKYLLSNLKQNAKIGNPELTYKSLGEIALNLQQNFCNSHQDSLSWLKQELSIDANQNMNNLAASLYGKSSEVWDNNLFVNTVIPEIKELHKKLQSAKINKNNKRKLKDIYPE